MTKKQLIEKMVRKIIKEELDNQSIQKLARDVAELTDANNHGEARLEIATRLQLDEYIKIFTAINKKHDSIGHMTQSLIDERDIATTKMLKLIEAKYGRKVRNILYKSL